MPDVLEFAAPPTMARFMKSNSFGRIACGPVGSGKTAACIIELFRRAVQQEPGPDGLRHTRYAVVRQTLKQLKDTVLKDVQQWLGPFGYWKVSENTFHLNFDDVRSEWMFIPLENAEDQGRLLSMQLTAAWLSECIEMNLDVVAPLSGRLGRFPSKAFGQPTWFGVIADTNMPTEMTPWYQFMENLPPEWQKFRQPSGTAPNAENLNWLLQNSKTILLPLDHPQRLEQGRKFYQRLIDMHGADSDWVKRYVHAEYGNDPSGEAVFRNSWRSDFHVKSETFLIPGYPLIIGQDFGRNPWSIICQIDHRGRLLVHQEVPANNIGLEKHIIESLRPILLSDRYMGYKIAIVGDPAGVAKSSHSEETSFELIQRLGIPAIPAPTNDIDPRLRAVEALLTRQTDGGPALIVNGPLCPFLCRAMSGGYRFTKTKQGALKAIPDKNDPEGFSHVADALQYAALAAHGNMGAYIAQRIYGRPKRLRPAITAKGWT